MFQRVQEALADRQPYWRRWGVLRGSWARRQLKPLKRSPPGTRVSFGVPGIPHRVWARAGTADQWVYEQIFVKAELDVALPSEPAWIIDAGANVGYATTWLATRYPRAEITALEIDRDNVELLRLNTGPISSRVTVLDHGLWSRKARLEIMNPDAETWSYRPVETPDGPIAALGVADLLAQSGRERIGLLKIDIEGSEIEVLATADQWIHRVDAMLIELHERFRPGCAAALDRLLGSGGFRVAVTGDYHLITRALA